MIQNNVIITTSPSDTHKEINLPELTFLKSLMMICLSSHKSELFSYLRLKIPGGNQGPVGRQMGD